MQAQPQAELVRTELALVSSVCGGAPPVAVGGAVPAQPVVAAPPAGPAGEEGATKWNGSLKFALHLACRPDLVSNCSMTWARLCAAGPIGLAHRPCAVGQRRR